MIWRRLHRHEHGGWNLGINQKHVYQTPSRFHLWDSPKLEDQMKTIHIYIYLTYSEQRKRKCTTKECSLWGSQAKFSTLPLVDHFKPECEGSLPSFCNVYKLDTQHNDNFVHLEDKMEGRYSPILQCDHATHWGVLLEHNGSKRPLEPVNQTQQTMSQCHRCLRAWTQFHLHTSFLWFSRVTLHFPVATSQTLTFLSALPLATMFLYCSKLKFKSNESEAEIIFNQRA